MAAPSLLLPLLLLLGSCTEGASAENGTKANSSTSSLQDLSLDDLDMSMLTESPSGCNLNTSAAGGCEELCECVGGKAVCRPRCSGPLIRRGRKLEDPTCSEKPVDDCCAVLQCPDSEPEALEGCFYKNMTLQRGEIYQDGCNATCSCGEAGKVNCKARCPKIPAVLEKGCVALTDPKDKCCTMLSCAKSENTTSSDSNSTVPLSDGCDFKGNHYALHAEFHDGCEALCVCSSSGVDCVPLRCPEDGLELLDPNCVQWDLHPKDFVPTPPHCCPEEMKCRFNGSCVYQGQTFNNWAEIPQALTGCEQNCHCEFGNVTCNQVCRPVPETPPNEGCSLGKPPGEDCCQYWICQGKDVQEHNVSGSLKIDDLPSTRNGHKDNVHLLLPGPVNLYDLKVSKPETKQPSTAGPVLSKQQSVPKQSGKQEKHKNSGQIFITPPPPLPGEIIKDVHIPLHPTIPPDLTEEMRNDSTHTNVSQSPLTETELPNVTQKPTPPATVFHNSDSVEDSHDEDVDSVLYPGPILHPNKMTSSERPTQAGNPKRPTHDPDLDQLDINGNLHHDQQLVWVPNSGGQFVEQGPFHPPQVFPSPGKKSDVKDIIAHLQRQGLLPHGSHVKVIEEGPQRPPLGIPPEHILYHMQQSGRPEPGRPIHIPEDVFIQQQRLPINQSPSGQLGPNPGDILHHLQFLPSETRTPGESSKKALPQGFIPPSLPSRPNYPPLPEEILFQLQQHGLLPEGPAALLRNQTGHGPNDNHPPSGFPRAPSQHPDEIVVHTLEAVDSNSVRLVFSVPPVLVGLHGRIELRFTSDKGNNDVTSWQQQILAPPNELISTPQLEFVLGDLVPDTEYRVKVMVQLRDLHNSPSSPVLTVRTMAPALPAVIPVDPELSVASVNSTWVEVRWGTFSDYDAQFIDGIQLRYKEVEGKVYSSTPLIHKAVNSYRLDSLRPGARYEVAIYFIPFPGQTTELQATNRIKVETLPLPDPYKFDVTVAVQQVKSTSAEVTWTGVPYPQDKYVNVFRAIYQSDLGKEDLSVYKVAKHDAQSQTLVQDLKPGTRYRLWLEIYLTNGKIKKSNVLDFTTKPGSATATQQGKLEAGGDLASVTQAGNYYSPLVAVSVLAALAILATLILLLILMKKHSQNKAAISTTSRKSQSAYDNPSYKTCENNSTVTNGSSAQRTTETA